MINRCSGLHPPAGIDEFRASQSSSSGCVGGSPKLAEVVRRPDDPAAEMLLPDAIDHHAGRQPVVGRGNPVGQLRPAPVRLGVLGAAWERGLRRRPESTGTADHFRPGTWALPRRARTCRVPASRLPSPPSQIGRSRFVSFNASSFACNASYSSIPLLAEQLAAVRADHLAMSLKSARLFYRPVAAESCRRGTSGPVQRTSSPQPWSR